MGGVDVIVPCYNYGRYLPRCVNSVLHAQGVETRVLVIDDCSSDDSAEVAAALAASDPRVTFVRHPVNRGHIATYNEGLEWASAEYALLLSADDWVLPGALARAAELLDTEPDVGFAFGPAVFVHDGKPRPAELDSEPVPGWRVMPGVEFIRSCAYWNHVATCTVVVRTALQKRLGGYDPALPHAGDLEMWMRFALHASVGRLNAYQGAYWHHAANMSVYYYERMLRDFEQRKVVLDRLFRNYGEAVEEIREDLLKGLAQATMHNANRPFNNGDLKQFEELRAFAASVHPGVRKLRHWQVQNVKRLLGPKVWSRLRPPGRRPHP